MIAQNESIPRLIADFSPDRIGQLVTDRLAGSSRVPIFHASREEVPEDRKPRLPGFGKLRRGPAPVSELA